MFKYIKDYLQELLTLTNEMSPYLLLGFLFAGILHIYVKKERIKKHLGKPDFKSVLYASLLGIPLPLCSCGVIPTGLSFYKDGASKGATISFLISTPQTGIDSIMVTYSLLGLPFTIIRPVVALLSGITGGVFTNLLEKSKPKITISQFETVNKATHFKGKRLGEMFRYAFIEFLQDISKWLIIGLLLAALISVILPDNFFITYIDNTFLTYLIVIAASIPLYVCATGSVPIAAVLMMKGLSPGAALVFLMAGPATNIATITVLAKNMGKRALFSYLLSIFFGAIASGLLIDLFLPAELFNSFLIMEHSDHQHFLPEWLKVSSTILLSLLLINGLLRKYYINNNKPENMQHILVVKGMSCNHCKANVESNLIKIDGIHDVLADTSKNEVYFKSDKEINIEQLKLLIENLGYEFGGLK